MHHLHDLCTVTQHSPWRQHHAGAALGAGDAVTKVMAPEQSFTTSPPVGAGSQLRFIAWADSGQATYDGTNEYDYSEVGAGKTDVCVLQRTKSFCFVKYSGMMRLEWLLSSSSAALCVRTTVQTPLLIHTQLVLVLFQGLWCDILKKVHGANRTTTL